MKNIIKELLPYVLILGGVILIRTFIVTPVIVSGDSMKPNLHNGELLLERITFPVLVIQIFVAVDLARPSDIWTWIGSNGSSSLDQK